jgi:ABC-2 type transport system permease protein
MLWAVMPAERSAGPARILPLKYGVHGLREIMLNGKSLIDVSSDLAVLVAFAVAVSVLAAFTLRRGSG